MTNAAAVVPDGANEVPTGVEANVEAQGELKKLIAQRDALKAKLREVEPAAAKLRELEQAQMSEVDKAKARISELEPLAAKSERMEKVVSGLLERALETIPEDMRDVVPTQLSAEDRLAWIEAAKAKGLFKVADTTPPPKDSPMLKRPAAAGGTTITKSVLADMPIGPRRQATMQAIREGKLSVIDG